MDASLLDMVEGSTPQEREAALIRQVEAMRIQRDKARKEVKAMIAYLVIAKGFLFTAATYRFTRDEQFDCYKFLDTIEGLIVSKVDEEKEAVPMCLRCGLREQFQTIRSWCAECEYYHEVTPTRQRLGMKFLSFEDFKAGRH